MTYCLIFSRKRVCEKSNEVNKMFVKACNLLSPHLATDDVSYARTISHSAIGKGFTVLYSTPHARRRFAAYSGPYHFRNHKMEYVLLLLLQQEEAANHQRSVG